MSILQDQQNFMNAAGQETEQFNKNQTNLYAKLIVEESTEFLAEAYQEYEGVVCNEHTIKEACDVIVVAAGYIISALGKEKAQIAWDIVNANNMAKTLGSIEKRADGKIMKGDTGKAERKAKMMGELLELLNDDR